MEIQLFFRQRHVLLSFSIFVVAYTVTKVLPKLFSFFCGKKTEFSFFEIPIIRYCLQLSIGDKAESLESCSVMWEDFNYIQTVAADNEATSIMSADVMAHSHWRRIHGRIYGTNAN